MLEEKACILHSIFEAINRRNKQPTTVSIVFSSHKEKKSNYQTGKIKKKWLIFLKMEGVPLCFSQF